MDGQHSREKPASVRHFSVDAIVECMSDGFVAFDRNWRYTYVNRHAAHLFSTTPQALLGRKYLECFPEAEGTRFHLAYKKAMEEHVALDIEEYFPPWQRWFENHIYPTADGISIFFHEITARKKIETDLRYQQQLTSFIIDALPISIYLKDEQGRYLMFNAEAARTVNISQAETLGKTVFDLLPQHIAKSIQEDEHRAFTTGEQILTERTIVVQSRQRHMLTGIRRFQLENDSPKLLGFALDITERKNSELQARYLASHDPLTGLPNRSVILDRLEHAIAHAQRNSRMVAVLFLDLDRFKSINDSLGHKSGDALLQIVAGRLRAAVRKDDTVARLGGDEFVIVLEDLESQVAITRIAEKIIAQFAVPLTLGNHELTVSTSIGISVYPLHHHDPDALLKNADIAMYHAKDKCGGQFEYYDVDMDALTFERLLLENDLRKAMDSTQLVLYFQPYIDLKTGRMIGMEALLRWNHPDKGLLGPDSFIPIAEDTGLIVALGKEVLHKACRQYRSWQEQGLQGLRMSVNLSAQQFSSVNLVSTVRSVLNDTGVNPSSMQFEITETGLMQDVQWAQQALQELSSLGIESAIDDFGTGYSSLSYLKTLPIHKLKVDRSFVTNVVNDKDDAAIVVATIGLAHNMGLRVIAEGVETSRQYSFLDSHQCDEGQGYFFSAPLNAHAMEAMLARQNLLGRQSRFS